MRAQIRGTAQARRNAQDGISLVQTAEGSLNEMHSILQRVRELAVQYGNGTLSTTDQAKITAEVAQLTAELVRIRDSSTFNGIALFSSSATTTITIQVGGNQNLDSASNTNRVGVTTSALDFSTISMDVSQIDTAISSVSTVRSDLGAKQNRLENAISNLGVYQENLTAAESRIRDVDVASEMVNFTRLQILSQSGTAMLAQANQAPAERPLAPAVGPRQRRLSAVPAERHGPPSQLRGGGPSSFCSKMICVAVFAMYPPYF